MPQHSMIPTDPRLTGLRLTVVDLTPDLIDGFTFGVETQLDAGRWSTHHSGLWSGVMTDLLPSTVGETVSAWLTGEGTRDVLRAIQSGEKSARVHKRRYEYS